MNFGFSNVPSSAHPSEPRFQKRDRDVKREIVQIHGREICDSAIVYLACTGLAERCANPKVIENVRARIAQRINPIFLIRNSRYFAPLAAESSLYITLSRPLTSAHVSKDSPGLRLPDFQNRCKRQRHTADAGLFAEDFRFFEQQLCGKCPTSSNGSAR